MFHFHNRSRFALLQEDISNMSHQKMNTESRAWSPKRFRPQAQAEAAAETDFIPRNGRQKRLPQPRPLSAPLYDVCRREQRHFQRFARRETICSFFKIMIPTTRIFPIPMRSVRHCFFLHLDILPLPHRVTRNMFYRIKVSLKCFIFRTPQQDEGSAMRF